MLYRPAAAVSALMRRSSLFCRRCRLLMSLPLSLPLSPGVYADE